MVVAHDWWRTFFSGIVLDMWTAAVPEAQTKADADFLQKLLKVAPPARLLDVPCGNGRIALEMATRGYRLSGVDLAESYIEDARQQSAQRQLDIEWQLGDMRELSGTATFDGAFCWGNSFGYLDEPGNLIFLKAVARVLKPGARFAIAYGALLESLLPNFREHNWYEIGDILFLIANELDHRHGRLNTEYTFIRDGKVDRRLGSQRTYSYSELCRVFGEAGFADPEGYASPALDPYKLGAQCVYLVGTRAN